MSFSSSTEVSPRSGSTTASRIFSSVKRSLSHSSPKKRSYPPDSWNSNSPRYSVDEYPPRSFTPSQLRYQDPSATRPTIEQIAMGLHVSRTPHLRSGKPHPLGPLSIPSHHPHPHHHSHYSCSTLVLPAPPTRSSLKRGSNPPTASGNTTRTNTPLPSSASMTSTTLDSPAPSLMLRKTNSVASSTGATNAPMSFKTRMSRLLPIRRATYSNPSTEPPPLTREHSAPQQRKAVRFSSSTLGLDEKAKVHSVSR